MTMLIIRFENGTSQKERKRVEESLLNQFNGSMQAGLLYPTWAPDVEGSDEETAGKAWLEQQPAVAEAIFLPRFSGRGSLKRPGEGQ